MEANDLRIGNTVLLNNRINTIDISWFECCKDSIYGRDIRHDTSPIPLTEEWLVKFGFEYLADIELSMEKIYMHKNMKQTLFIEVGENFTIKSKCQDVTNKYVHQLQNLYFALTGKELTMLS